MAKKEVARGRGRPATGQTPKRYFRMDDESWQLVVDAAAVSDDGNVSDFVRRVLLEATKRPKKARAAGKNA